MAMAVADTKFAVPALMVTHAFASWPDIAQAYCDPSAWRFKGIPVRAALDSTAASEYLHVNLGGAYDMARIIDRQTPPGSRIFCFHCPPQAYTSRELMAYNESLEGTALADML